MSSILDNAIMVGKETTYGTPAVLSRAYEAQADTWAREQEALESVVPLDLCKLVTRMRIRQRLPPCLTLLLCRTRSRS